LGHILRLKLAAGWFEHGIHEKLWMSLNGNKAKNVPRSHFCKNFPRELNE